MTSSRATNSDDGVEENFRNAGLQRHFHAGDHPRRHNCIQPLCKLQNFI